MLLLRQPTWNYYVRKEPPAQVKVFIFPLTLTSKINFPYCPSTCTNYSDLSTGLWPEKSEFQTINNRWLFPVKRARKNEQWARARAWCAHGGRGEKLATPFLTSQVSPREKAPRHLCVLECQQNPVRWHQQGPVSWPSRHSGKQGLQGQVQFYTNKIAKAKIHY